MFMRWYYWPLFAFVMGIALGGNVVAAFVQPIEQTQQAHPNQSANEIAVSMSAEERIADYTWTLDILTGVLAIATVGLLVATALGLVRYFDGFTEGRETYFCHRYYYGQTANAKHYTMPAEVGRYHSEGNAAT